MLTEAQFMGGGTELSSSANITLTRLYRCWYLDEASANLSYDVTLPDATTFKVTPTTLKSGGPIYILSHNTASTGVATIKDNDGNVLTTLQNQHCLLALKQDGTAAGAWKVIRRP